MALAAMLEKIDDLPEHFQKEYKKLDNGKFVLDVTPVDGLALENAASLKKALSTERSSVTELKNQLKSFEGIDVEKAKQALEKMEELGDFDLSDHKKATEALKVKEQQLQQKFETDRKKEKEKFDKDLQDERNRGLTLQKQINKVLITSVASRAIADVGGKLPLLMPIVEKFTRTKQREDGEFGIEVLDEQGQVRLSLKTGSTDPMSVSEFVEFLKSSKDYEAAFPASGSSGSGAAGGGTGRGAGGFTIKESEAKDVGKYRAAKEEAQKAGQPLQLIPG